MPEDPAVRLPPPPERRIVNRIHRWLRRRFGPLWVTHVLCNVCVTTAMLVASLIWLPRFFVVAFAMLLGGGVTNAVCVYGLRRDVERDGWLDALDRGVTHD